MESYNNQTQWSRIKAAFAQTFRPTYNTPQDINFVDGLSAEKRRSMSQTGSTPNPLKTTAWSVQTMPSSRGR